MKCKKKKLYFSHLYSEKKEENAIFLISCSVPRLPFTQDLTMLDSVLSVSITLSYLILRKNI